MNSQESGQQQPLKAFKARPVPINLPTDAQDAAAFVLAYVQTAETAFDRAAAIDAMTVRVEQLRSATGDQCERELLSHAAIAEALFLRFSAASVQSTVPANQAIFGKLALNCQAAYIRTIVAVQGLKQARQGLAAITQNED